MPRADGRSHASAIFHDFWYNPMWRHGEVAWALLETILMAFLGTFGAAIFAILLAFFAAMIYSLYGLLHNEDKLAFLVNFC